VFFIYTCIESMPVGGADWQGSAAVLDVQATMAAKPRTSLFSILIPSSNNHISLDYEFRAPDQIASIRIMASNEACLHCPVGAPFRRKYFFTFRSKETRLSGSWNLDLNPPTTKFTARSCTRLWTNKARAILVSHTCGVLLSSRNLSFVKMLQARLPLPHYTQLARGFEGFEE
jgi:hypothetical protein